MSPVTRSLYVAALAMLLSWPAGAQPARTRSPHERLDRECAACHTTAGWRQIAFDHDRTAFPLEGAHAALGCTDCHRVARFDELEADCGACHVEPHRQALGPDCARCHEATAWVPAAGFTHELTAFPLWGAHAATDCAQCHVDQASYQFTDPPGMCMDCHEADFGRASVAVHLTAGPDCETCHTLDRWQGGHDPVWFEIRSGHHDVACGRCHQRGTDYVSYTCAECHEFSLQVREHRGIDPADARCLECHSRGGFHVD